MLWLQGDLAGPVGILFLLFHLDPYKHVPLHTCLNKNGSAAVSCSLSVNLSKQQSTVFVQSDFLLVLSLKTEIASLPACLTINCKC